MYGTFSSASHFNVDISGWNVGSVTTMEYVFRNAKKFNINISKWNIGNVKNMHDLTWNANTFNQNLCAWKNYSNFPYHVDDLAMFHWTSCNQMWSVPGKIMHIFYIPDVPL
jgi:surface protein